MVCFFLPREFRSAGKNSQGTILVPNQNATWIFITVTSFTALDMVKRVLVMLFSEGAKHLVSRVCLSVFGSLLAAAFFLPW